MTLDEQRKVAEGIYRKHTIRVVAWKEDLACDVQSSCPRSEFDFHDSLDLANEEIRGAVGIS